MFNVNIDLGQVIIAGVAGAIAIIAWFSKKELSTIGKRLDTHERTIFKLAGDVQKLIGRYESLTNSEPSGIWPKNRRRNERNQQ